MHIYEIKIIVALLKFVSRWKSVNVGLFIRQEDTDALTQSFQTFSDVFRRFQTFQTFQTAK